MPAPNSKYSEERVQKLLAAIRETGSIKAGWKAAGISKVTYYSWLNAHSPLVQKVQSALDDFQRNVDPEHKEQALNQLYNYLYGKVKQSNTYEVERVEEMFTKSGEPILGPDGKPMTKTIIEKKKVVSSVPTPQWAIERLLGKRLELGDAIGTFVAYGYKPQRVENGFLFIESGEVNDELGITAEGERSQVESEHQEAD